MVNISLLSVTILPKNIIDPLIDNLLGDGSLQFNHKEKDGKPKGNAIFTMTLKQKEYSDHLWGKVYSPICTKTSPSPWPNPKTGKEISQYNLKTRSLPALSSIHNEWYRWSDQLNKFTKIVPLNIEDLLTPIGLAHWIMDDGYWENDSSTVFLCTDNFTLDEISLLIKILTKNFNLTTTTKKKNQI